MKRKSLRSQQIKRIILKSPSIPLCLSATGRRLPKGEKPISFLWQREVACLREAPPPEALRRAGASAKAGEGFYVKIPIG